MAPQTPSRSRLSHDSDPDTPASKYVLAPESPTRSPTSAKPKPLMIHISGGGGLAAASDDGESDGGYTVDQPRDSRDTTTLDHEVPDDDLGAELDRIGAELDVEPESSTPSYASTSFNDDSMLEVLDDDDDNEDSEEVFEDGDEETDVGSPLVHRGRRRRRQWSHEEQKREKSLLELIPSLILAHPLPLLPMLSLLPYNFLPAGVVFFVPAICVLAALSACAHIVIVYLAWYLKVPSFEDVFATVMGKYGRAGVWGGRLVVMLSVIGLLVGWLETLHPLLQPVVETYLPSNSFTQSRSAWTVLASAALLPSLVPSRMTKNIRRSPIVLALLLPVVAFLVIGRTVEITKAQEAEDLARRAFGLSKGSSAGAGLTTLTIFLSPQVNTLPIHSHLNRNKRASFPAPCLASSLVILVLSLPLALVPYYLLPALPNVDELPTATPTTPSGVFGRLPADDAWVNVARVLMCAIVLGTSNMWIIRGRDILLKSLGVERGDRQRAGRWVGTGLWVVVVGLACLSGIVAEKIELLGVMATLATCWFLPSLFFIITFHVRSPLAIVFPSKNPPPPEALDALEQPRSSSRRTSHSRADSLADPSADVLLARKERQLQKRRTDRRLWQDLIVYIGILPVGSMGLLWTSGALLGLW